MLKMLYDAGDGRVSHKLTALGFEGFVLPENDTQTRYFVPFSTAATADFVASLAQASRMNFSTRLFNLLVTNVPGPQFPLYILGRELQELFPVAFLPGNHALAVAIMSYNGGIDFGLLGDYNAMPDLDAFAQMLDDARQELVDAARATASNGQRASSPKRTSRPRTSSPASTEA